MVAAARGLTPLWIFHRRQTRRDRAALAYIRDKPGDPLRTRGYLQSRQIPVNPKGRGWDVQLADLAEPYIVNVKFNEFFPVPNVWFDLEVEFICS